jgi:hypothetical protein
MKFPAFLTCFIAVSLLSGCATWKHHGVVTDPDRKYHIEVLPVVVTADIEKVSDIMTPPKETTNEQALIKEQLQKVETQLTEFLNSRLGESNYIQIVPVKSALEHAGIISSISPDNWNIEKLQKLNTDYGIQAVLAVNVAGYGKLEKKWLTFLIGSGIVEGVVQGVLAAKVVNNTWVGIAVGVEEIVQEILVWGGGSYLFSKHYSPVTLEAQLISTSDGKVIWDDTVFVSVDKRAIEKLPEEDREKRELHLILTAKKAINELVSDINKKARRNTGNKSSLSHK